jgi:hypothetical protein
LVREGDGTVDEDIAGAGDRAGEIGTLQTERAGVEDDSSALEIPHGGNGAAEIQRRAGVDGRAGVRTQHAARNGIA